MVCLYQVRSMHVVQRNPLVIAVWEALPLDKILEFLISSKELVIQDTFYLLFFFSINQIRGRPREVWSMGQSFKV